MIFEIIMKNYFRWYVTFLISILLFGGGVLVGAKSDGTFTPVANGGGENTVGTLIPANILENLPKGLKENSAFNWGLLKNIWEYAAENYVEQPVDPKKLFEGAISGSIQALGDPYTLYLNPELTREFSNELSGEFFGIGAEIGMKKGLLTIVAPLEGSPAQKTGVRAGDKVLSIDGEETSLMSLDYAVSRIRGKEGTQVKLMLYREGDEAPREVVITRGKIIFQAVKSKMIGDIAYLELLQFGENSERDLKKAAQELMKQNPKGLVLDLRNNPGGFLDEAIGIASFWIPDAQVVVKEKYSDGKIDEYKSRGSAFLSDIPTIVLVNNGSASGSEIVAAALHAYGKATLVGKQTFGKGSVQELRNFSDGSSVKLTIAKWLTPKDEEINEIGIKPDVEIDRIQEDYDNDRDPQLDKALELLK